LIKSALQSCLVRSKLGSKLTSEEFDLRPPAFHPTNTCRGEWAATTHQGPRREIDGYARARARVECAACQQFSRVSSVAKEACMSAKETYKQVQCINKESKRTLLKRAVRKACARKGAQPANNSPKSSCPKRSLNICKRALQMSAL